MNESETRAEYSVKERIVQHNFGNHNRPAPNFP